MTRFGTMRVNNSALAGGPGFDARQFGGFPLGLGHVMGWPLDQHAPALAPDLVDRIDLERHQVVAAAIPVCRSSSSALCLAVRNTTFDAAGSASVAGLMSQSGGVGVALAGQLSRLGVGISSFASMGSKLDVSGNDMLMWWVHDDVTRLAVLYLESFGNPRKFARTARRVGATLPRAHRASCQ